MSERRSDPLPLVRAAELDTTAAAQRWLVDGLWLAGGVGLIAGHPKVGKSWMGLELALSVASGRPCLGRFAVEQPGKAVVYLAEDSLPAVRGRIDALCEHRGVDLAGLDLWVITAERLQLQIEAHAGALCETIERHRPRLLLLDPLVRLHRFDENRSYEMAGLLNYLRELQRVFGTCVVLVHHNSKQHHAHPGQALRGTGDFWAWADSALYLRRNRNHIVLSTEHRSAAATEPLALRISSRPDGSATHLEILDETTDDSGRQPSLEQRVLEALSGTAEPLRRAALRDLLRVNNHRLGEALAQLEQRRQVRRSDAGWTLATLPRPSSASDHAGPSDDPTQGSLF